MISRLFLSFLLIIAVGCDTDDAEFPELITFDAQQIGSTSVVLEAEIKESGPIRPLQYGFLWGTQPGLNIFTAPDKLDLGSTDAKRKFSIKLENLTAGTSYYVRSYVAYPDYSHVFYGNEITFSTLN